MPKNPPGSQARARARTAPRARTRRPIAVVAGTRMFDTVAAGLLLVVLTSPAVLSFDPEWLRPRYHSVNKLDGPGNYGVSS